VVLVRSWNLFHGNAVPPQRREFLEEMLELACADAPDVLCAQEVPAWALERFTCGDVAERPSFGPLPLTAWAGRRLTDIHHGVLRSAFEGQGNGILLAPRLELLSRDRLILNPRRFRDAQALALRLGALARLAWGSERRIVQSTRFRAPGGRTYFVANLHTTSFASDRRLADVELLRAAWHARSAAAPGDVVVLAGDFNLTPAESRTLRQLSSPEWGFSAAGPGIDHILVAGAAAGELRRWPEERRRRSEVLLSDHAPVELEVE
jgi:endonuclease/exonuclease/phosphatase family metal-dependent hydrolase